MTRTTRDSMDPERERAARDGSSDRRRAAVHDVEPASLRAALREARGRIGGAARALGVPRTTLSQLVRGDAELLALVEGLRGGSGRGRPPDASVTLERALAALDERGSLSAAARALRCHPDKLLRVVERGTERSRRRSGVDVREYVRRRLARAAR